MKITDSKSIGLPPDIPAGKPGPKNGAAAAPPTGEPIRLSALSSQLSQLETQLSAAPEFDAGKVDAIKQAIRDGRLTINAEAIADKLLVSVEEFLKKPH